MDRASPRRPIPVDRSCALAYQAPPWETVYAADEPDGERKNLLPLTLLSQPCFNGRLGQHAFTTLGTICVSHAARTDAIEPFQQRACRYQIRKFKSLGERLIDGCEQAARFGQVPLIPPKSSDGARGAQLKQQR